MVPLAKERVLRFKQAPGEPGRSATARRADDRPRPAGPRTQQPIVCRVCRHAITHPDQRISMQGAFEHAFVNPHGVVFRIGCFRLAPGCGYLGPPTHEFTWFRGFSWRIGLCTNCLINIGWLFTSASGRFHGLILDRLIFPSGDRHV